jgi:predicted lipoprotein with Yx(FWY)xxD motif
MKHRLTSALPALATMAAAVKAMGMIAAPPASGETTSPAATVTVISAEPSPYGNVLSVGSGRFSGYSVYLFNRDQAGRIACNTTVVAAVNVSCAGSETDATADWPAVETTGAPIAGPGVNHRLLGRIYRKDLKASQVTYAGHPLYLFDMGPHQFAGEDFVESVLPLPPWHGIWYLVHPRRGCRQPARPPLPPRPWPLASQS